MRMLKFIQPKIDRLLTQLPYLPQTAKLVWTSARGWTIAWATLLIWQGILPVALVLLTRTLVDRLVMAVNGGGWISFYPILWLVGLLAGLTLLQEGLRSITGWVRTAQAELVQDHVFSLIHTQATQLDLSFYETPTYYDRLYQAQVDAINRPVALLENTGTLLQNSLTLIAMVGVLFSFGLILPLVLVVSTLPAFYIILRYTVRQNAWRVRTTPLRRRSRYYNWLLTERDSAAEIRLFGLGDYFQTAFGRLRSVLRNQQILLARDQALAELAAGGFALLTTGAAVGWMSWRVVQGDITLGDLALFYQAFSQGQRLLRSLLQGAGQVYGNLLFIENLFEFLAFRPRLVDPAEPLPVPPRLQVGIRFHGVTFGYPGSQRDAVNNFDLTIQAGQIVALVGENGAGKSTLLKLLCRLYDPEAGQITLDGIDLRRFRQADLQRCITVLFQQPVHYYETAAVNIALGDIAAKPGQAEIEAAARAAGADSPIRRLDAAYETTLGKWFNGAELSNGEWQRVALARAFLRQASLIILDEPTSALDSWAEADWMERFRQLATGRTALVITHRFTTARQADIIHVMQAGQIVESGSHDDLLAQEGRYAVSWRAQMRDGVNWPMLDEIYSPK